MDEFNRVLSEIVDDLDMLVDIVTAEPTTLDDGLIGGHLCAARDIVAGLLSDEAQAERKAERDLAKLPPGKPAH